MILNSDNYFSKEANLEFMGSTQLKNFIKCEAMAMATLKEAWNHDDKAWKPLPKECYLEGNYVDAWNNGDLYKFKMEHPELYSSTGKTKGELKSTIKYLDTMIKVMEKDNMFMNSLVGEKQKIFTAEMFGAPWKIAIDSYFPDKKRFTDLKALKEIYNKDGNYWDTFRKLGYYLQMAIYAEIEKLANNRNNYFEPFLAIVTKQKPYPDKAIISFKSNVESVEEFVAKQMVIVKHHMPRVLAVKSGKEKPTRCEKCEYCLCNKKLTGTIHYSEF